MDTHTPIIAAPNRPTLDMPHTADVGILCGSCLETLAPDGACLNIGACVDADTGAAKGSRRETVKSRVTAWTIRGNID